MDSETKSKIKKLVLYLRHALEDELAIILKRYGLDTQRTWSLEEPPGRLSDPGEIDIWRRLVAVIRQGRLVALGHPDELRARRGGSCVEILGRGFAEPVLGLLRRRPQVAAAEAQNGRLIIDLNQETAMAPLLPGSQTRPTG